MNASKCLAKINMIISGKEAEIGHGRESTFSVFLEFLLAISISVSLMRRINTNEEHKGKGGRISQSSTLKDEEEVFNK